MGYVPPVEGRGWSSVLKKGNTAFGKFVGKIKNVCEGNKGTRNLKFHGVKFTGAESPQKNKATLKFFFFFLEEKSALKEFSVIPPQIK
ncbi:hypothetical protein, partial [Caldanaerobacter subterraneus]|uniref:hypothetical protein n=1 Tax=Caldanaerobacter subterraneus TaxID=911092 RepID=UPI0006181B8A